MLLSPVVKILFITPPSFPMKKDILWRQESTVGRSPEPALEDHMVVPDQKLMASGSCLLLLSISGWAKVMEVQSSSSAIHAFLSCLWGSCCHLTFQSLQPRCRGAAPAPQRHSAFSSIPAAALLHPLQDLSLCGTCLEESGGESNMSSSSRVGGESA